MTMLPPPPPNTNMSVDFSFLPACDVAMITSAYDVVKKYEAWDLLKSFDGESFITSRDPAILKLMHKVNDEYPGHSDASLGCTMRDLEFIAKYGFDVYRSTFLPKK